MKKRVTAFFLTLSVWLAAAACSEAILLSGAPSSSCWTTGSDGWTVICESATTTGTCAAGTADGTCKRYVSTSGSDAGGGNDCLTQGSPCLTLLHAASQVRSGKPDWLLLKRGDTFTPTTGNKMSFFSSGVSATAPVLISSYGSGAYPIIDTSDSGVGVNIFTGQVRYLAIIGVKFYASKRDPTNPAYDSGQLSAAPTGINVGLSTGNSEWVLIEDVSITFQGTGINFYGDADAFHTIIKIRRNNLSYNFSTAGQVGTGALIGEVITSGSILLEENLFDHNGWYPAVVDPSVFVHNVYVQGMQPGGPMGPVNATKNIFAQDGAGTQFRSGGSITSNLFVANPYAHNIGAPNPAVTNVVTGNVYTASQATVAELGGTGFGTVDAYQGVNFAQGPATVSDNIMSMSGVTSSGWGIQVGNAQNGWVVSDNIICAWPAPIRFGALGGGGVLTFTVLNQGSGYTDNSYTEIELTGGTGSQWKVNLTVSGGVITATATAFGDFNWRGSAYTVNDMITVNNALIGGTGSGFSARVDTVTVNTNTNNHLKESACSAGSWTGTQPTLTDPTRTTLTYDTSVGGPGTLAHFLAQSALNNKDSWNAVYTAAPVIAHIRAGFGL